METYPKRSQPSEDSAAHGRIRAVTNLSRAVRGRLGQAKKECFRSRVDDLAVKSVAGEGSTQMEERRRRELEETHDGDKEETNG